MIAAPPGGPGPRTPVHTPFTSATRRRNDRRDSIAREIGELRSQMGRVGDRRTNGGNHVESRTPKEVLDLAKSADATFVDLRFCDLPGIMQHFSMPIHELTEDGFDDGYGFDGSSIRGFQEIQESDMLLIPDPDTAVVDPFREHVTLNINCFVRDPVTAESYTRDPRYVA